MKLNIKRKLQLACEFVAYKAGLTVGFIANKAEALLYRIAGSNEAAIDELNKDGYKYIYATIFVGAVASILVMAVFFIAGVTVGAII